MVTTRTVFFKIKHPPRHHGYEKPMFTVSRKQETNKHFATLIMPPDFQLFS